MKLGNLSKDVFERRSSTGSEAFLLFICLDAIKFLSLTFFSLLKTIYPRVLTKLPPNDAKSLLPVDVRRSKTLLLKFPIKPITWLLVYPEISSDTKIGRALLRTRAFLKKKQGGGTNIFCEHLPTSSQAANFLFGGKKSPGIRTFWGRLNKNKNFKMINQHFFGLLSWVLLSTESLFFWVVVFEADVSPGSSVLCHSIFCLCCLTASWTLSSIISSVRTPSGEPYALAWN